MKALFAMLSDIFSSQSTVRILKLSIIFGFRNHRELRGHREKLQTSKFSAYSVVDYLRRINNETL